MANSLLDFVMSVVRDPDVAAQYAANPGQAIADAHLVGVTTADVNGLIPVVAESLTTPVSTGDTFGDAGNVWSSGAATAAFDAFDAPGVHHVNDSGLHAIVDAGTAGPPDVASAGDPAFDHDVPVVVNPLGADAGGGSGFGHDVPGALDGLDGLDGPGGLDVPEWHGLDAVHDGPHDPGHPDPTGFDLFT